MKRVIGIGNALTDMLVNLKTDKVLDTFNLPKGSMSLVDAALQTEISKSVAGLPYSLSLGGSAGNTIRAMARLGCDVGFIGKVGTDKTGDFFIQALIYLLFLLIFFYLLLIILLFLKVLAFSYMCLLKILFFSIFGYFHDDLKVRHLELACSRNFLVLYIADILVNYL